MDSYSAKRTLKFFKSDDLKDKLTIAFNISANHQLDGTLYQSINDFIENLLISDYITEEMYNERMEEEDEEKEQLKEQKAQEKLDKAEQKLLEKEKQKELKEQEKKFKEQKAASDKYWKDKDRKVAKAKVTEKTATKPVKTRKPTLIY